MPYKTFVFVVLLLCIYSSCSSPKGYDTNKVQSATFQGTSALETIQVIHFDYDNIEERLTRKYQTVAESNPNKLEIAINNFLSKTHFGDHYSDLYFDYLDSKDEWITFHFKGNFDFERIDEEQIFKKALELTITNYTNNVNIDLVFNDNKF